MYRPGRPKPRPSALRSGRGRSVRVPEAELGGADAVHLHQPRQVSEEGHLGLSGVLQGTLQL